MSAALVLVESVNSSISKMGTTMSDLSDQESTAVFSALIGASVVKFASLVYLRYAKQQKFVEVGEVAGIYLYPVKSTYGWSLQSADCTPLGIRYNGVTDRHLLVSQADGSCLTIRTEPRMTLIKTEVQGDYLVFSAPGMETLKVQKEQTPNPLNMKPCKIWDETVKVVDSGEEASNWFSRFMNKVGLRLMYYAPEIPKRDAFSIRKPWEHKAQPGDNTAFADDSAYLITSTDSLDKVNQDLSSSVTIRNFRPNIVVSGNGAFKEETWSEIRIGNAAFRAIDLCARCLATTVNPDTGERCVKQEPLATLKKLNSNPAYLNKPIFGVNAALDSPGKINVGDKVYAFVV